MDGVRVVQWCDESLRAFGIALRCLGYGCRQAWPGLRRAVGLVLGLALASPSVGDRVRRAHA
eukprot:3054456-Pleurochrysis_carterae.AAC.1